MEAFGYEARDKNVELVGGKEVLLEADVSETDRYGRLLRYVYVGGLLVNAEMVRLGLANAVAYPPEIRYQDTLRQMEDDSHAIGLFVASRHAARVQAGRGVLLCRCVPRRVRHRVRYADVRGGATSRPYSCG